MLKHILMKKIYASLLSIAMGATMAANAAEVPANAVCYDGSTPGSLVIDMGTGDILEGKGVGMVYITPAGDGKVDFLLPDLSLGDMGTIGDIQLDGVTATTEADGTTVYNATVEDYSLLGGAIHAKVTLANGEGKSCTTTANGEAHFDIDVIWFVDYPTNESAMPIYVTFNGKLKASSIGDLNVDEAAEAIYFDLQGNRVNADALVNGQTYIKRQGNTVTKVIK